MARNSTDKILYDGSNDRTTLLMSLIGPALTAILEAAFGG